MTTCAPLDKLREKALADTALRRIVPETLVFVHMGECGLAQGAREIMAAFLDEWEKNDPGTVLVFPADCAGQCTSEPNVTVCQKGNESALYHNMDPDKARDVYQRHVLNREIQTQWTRPATLTERTL